jgi:uncharacterized protein with PIN domain
MEETKRCPFCAEEIKVDAVRCKHCKTDLPNVIVTNDQPAISTKSSKTIQETRCTCQACGNVWFYGKQDVKMNQANAMGNLGKSMMCCGGCLPALLIPDKKIVDLNKCPKCNSAAITKEQAVYEV